MFEQRIFKGRNITWLLHAFVLGSHGGSEQRLTLLLYETQAFLYSDLLYVLRARLPTLPYTALQTAPRSLL